MSYKIFINYLEDNSIHLQYAMFLREFFVKCGCNPFVDKEDLIPGQKANTIIKATISNADYCILLVSKETLSLPSGSKTQYMRCINMMLDTAEEMCTGDIFILPIIIDCLSKDDFKDTTSLDYHISKLVPFKMPYNDTEAIKKGLIELIRIMGMREPQSKEQYVKNLAIPYMK